MFIDWDFVIVFFFIEILIVLGEDDVRFFRGYFLLEVVDLVIILIYISVLLEDGFM